MYVGIKQDSRKFNSLLLSIGHFCLINFSAVTKYNLIEINNFSIIVFSKISIIKETKLFKKARIKRYNVFE